MTYYAELPSGKRMKITQYAYEMLVNAHGWLHVLRYPDFEVIKSNYRG